jgi:EAL domain-containing protein (putative c-di-GMP-specific phosphodiesterase class I)
VKVDRSLIAAIDYDPMQQAMLMALVTTAAGNGVDLVAEGIERSRQRQMLQSLGCRYGQGFHLAPPLTVAEMEAALADPAGRWCAHATGRGGAREG